MGFVRLAPVVSTTKVCSVDMNAVSNFQYSTLYGNFHIIPQFSLEWTDKTRIYTNSSKRRAKVKH